jgi:hypothetical protein
MGAYAQPEGPHVPGVVYERRDVPMQTASGGEVQP